MPSPIKAAEDIASRTLCADFEVSKPLFEGMQHELDSGTRKSRVIRKDAGFLKADIKAGEFFILGGQTLLVADVGEAIKAVSMPNASCSSMKHGPRPT